jgi:hypothetical protein
LKKTPIQQRNKTIEQISRYYDSEESEAEKSSIGFEIDEGTDSQLCILFICGLFRAAVST